MQTRQKPRSHDTGSPQTASHAPSAMDRREPSNSLMASELSEIRETELNAGLWLIPAIVGCTSTVANNQVSEVASRYAKAGVETGLVNEALQKNSFYFSSSASSAKGYQLPGFLPQRGDNNLYINGNLTDAALLATAAHESTHDRLLRDSAGGTGTEATLAQLRATERDYANQSFMNDDGHPTRQIAPKEAIQAAHEAYAYYVAHQVKAQADAVDYAQSAIDYYIVGEIDETTCRKGLSEAATHYQEEVGRGDTSIRIAEIDGLVPPLSPQAKEWANQVLLHGHAYASFWEVPGVVAQMERAGLEP